MNEGRSERANNFDSYEHYVPYLDLVPRWFLPVLSLVVSVDENEKFVPTLENYLLPTNDNH